MTTIVLTPYWFPVPGHFGIGVTAPSLVEATKLATKVALDRGWAFDPRAVAQNVDVRKLDADTVLARMGDPRRAGVWFPPGE
jgi:hypothetical protein